MNNTVVEIERRKKIIEAYSENYRKRLEQGELAKAGEDLWGIVNNLAAIIAVLDKQKPPTTHRELRQLVNQLSIQDPELPQLLHAAERLHANYYHNFMDQELFREDKEKTEKLVYKLQKLIEQKLRKHKPITS